MGQKSFESKKKKGSETSGCLVLPLSEVKGCYSLDKKLVLRNKNEIKDIFLNGERLNFKNLVIIYKPDLCSKVGFFASRNLKGAVKRNRIKRILREAYRMNKEIFMGFKIIFFAKGLLDTPDVLNAFLLFQKECNDKRN